MLERWRRPFIIFSIYSILLCHFLFLFFTKLVVIRRVSLSGEGGRRNESEK
ncbi:hypothetical protein, unlikely [Trypanosoma brucei brucei TREU927]|uniref:Uncharacterized protein n=1 Tax=Trypanosoma brucei brucei (strain 927/4 GUTat10.1) TaxID=185431 RepID=Q38EY3_TRYB2|nr:hypothetical protein, unlikely [Trypanosoma brucei brucei TREU927]EAN76637.1 hypothetical protein, unlikely [Trypanosoma brucei brucei TREU927]